ARELVGAPPLRDSILVIASEPATELTAVLARAGFATVIAVTGVAGWEAAVRARPTAIVIGGTPDLDRAAVIRRLRLDPSLRPTPCIGIGAGDEVSALEAGADAFVGGGDPELVLA